MTIKLYLYNLVIITLCGIPLMRAYSQNSEIQLAAEYWNKGEKEKAYQTYKSLSKTSENLATLYSPFFNVLIEMEKYKEAMDLTERMIKRDPQNHNYRLDYGYVFLKSGDLLKADKIFKEAISDYSIDIFRIKSVADYFMQKGIPEYAENAFLDSRQKSGDPTLFALEMANALRLQGKKKEMVEEYLNYVTQTPGNTNYVKNLLQYLITRPEEQEDLQRLLISRVQKFPDSEIFADLLTWTYFQQKNFYGAFIQSRAFDKRFGRGTPSKTYELAQIAFNNKDFDIALRCYDFIVRDFSKSDVYLNARLGLIKSTEAKVKKSFPVKSDSIQLVINQYAQFKSQFPDNPISFEAQINSARLFAFYLNRLDSAARLLNQLVSNGKVTQQVRARAKLELGDIYVIRNEPWEATLLFSQVEKMQKDAPLGYEAKLRNARVSYYKGDFGLAEEHLDILEQATSREIANDALDLSLRISENTIADTLGIALRVYAAAELLIYQNKEQEALQFLNLIKEPAKPAKLHRSVIVPTALDVDSFSKANAGDSIWVTNTKEVVVKPIKDDVYWLEAGIRRRLGQFSLAVELLQKITDEYPLDILADDAMFLQAEILEQDLRQKDLAQDLYRDFLIRFPGSVYTAEARKRFRTLRGDFSQQPLN